MTSKLLSQENSLLLIIDLQEKLLKAQPKAKKIIEKASILAQTAQILEMPVIITEQYPQGLGSTHQDIKIKLDFTTKFFEKNAFSCPSEEGFWELLKSYNKKQIIICGIETHVCVHQTVNDLLNNIDEDFEVHIVQDALGSRDKYEHEKGIDRMIRDGAVPTCVETVLFELLTTSKHPKFKEVQALIK